MPGLFQRLTAFVLPRKPLQKDTKPPRNPPTTKSTSEVNQRLGSVEVEKKRKAASQSNRALSKRRRTSWENFTPVIDNFGDEENSQNYGGGNAVTDRLRMPPPAYSPTAHKGVKKPRPSKRAAAKSLVSEVGSESIVSFSTTAKREAGQLDEYDMEQARRHAAAIRLPANSGIWAHGEQELFYHLALRGFEPLLPSNWMLDFKTLPLSLYVRENNGDRALIHHMKDTEFRAIRALRDLIETGKLVRDKSLSSPGFHAETTLNKAVSKYVSWAITDGGFRTHPAAPVYSIATRRKGQSTTQLIAELTEKLHSLATKHRSLHDIHPSVELRDVVQLSNEKNTTQVYDEEDGLPVLIGIMIVSSVLAVFTMNPHTAVLLQGRQSTPGSQSKEPSQPTRSSTEESGIRFIATFDFSEPAHDVWNALAVAIVAMQIRKAMLQNPHPGSPGAEILHSSPRVGDKSEDPDA